MSETRQYYRVIIAGGGPAGLAAGLFTARYGLRTLILDRGKSSLRQCAYLENYLGFAGGVTTEAYLQLARTHVTDAGAEIRRQKVRSVGHTAEQQPRFQVHTSDHEIYGGDYFVAATPYDTQYLQGLGTGGEMDEGRVVELHVIDGYGRTKVEGLYFAGLLAGAENEALISAGQGAQMALGLVSDVRSEQGWWAAITHYLDWQVRQGLYEGRNWREKVYQHFRNTLPEQSPPDEQTIRQAIEAWIVERRQQQLQKQDIHTRADRGRRLRRECAENF